MIRISKEVKDSFIKELQKTFNKKDEKYVLLFVKENRNVFNFKCISNLETSEVIGKIEQSKINLVLSQQEEQEKKANLTYVG